MKWSKLEVLEHFMGPFDRDDKVKIVHMIPLNRKNGLVETY